MNSNMVAARILRSATSALNGKSVSLAQRRGFVQLGKKDMEQIKNWIPTLGVFGATSFVAMCYFTDWRVTNEWIPFYSGKFKSDD